MISPSAHREWVDWTQPLVPAAARWLRAFGDKSTSPQVHRSTGAKCTTNVDLWTFGPVDLSDVICVTPGRRAGRVLLEALLRECEGDGVALLPPRFVTPGALPEVIGESCETHGLQSVGFAPVATADEARFAWVRALKSCDPAAIRPLLPSPLAASRDLLAWHALAEILQKLHDELAGAMLSFGDVAERAARLELFGETDRWNALNHVHRAYIDVLSGANLRDPHRARIDALAKAHGVHAVGFGGDTAAHIILIGVAELNALQRLALKQSSRITAIVHAPQELSDAFDALGCVIPERWAERTIALREEQIIIADQPDDQAQAALELLAASHQEAPVDTITVGLGDEALGEPLERAADWADVRIHRAEAATLSRTAPYRLLEAVRDWIAEQRFAPFAALLRHPDIERWLVRQSAIGNRQSDEPPIADWLTLLDRYFSDHLHKRFAGDWLGEPEHRAQLKRIHDAVRTLASSLLERSERPISHWINPVLDILQSIYAEDLTVSPSRHLTVSSSRDACLAIRDALESLASIDESLEPTCDAATALTLFLEACAGESLSTQPRDDQIEVLGWLELHLDAAPNLIVMGVNDGNIPKSITADPFLPNSLRETLGLPSNSSRYARDVYLVEAIHRSRKVTLIAGRRGCDGDPLTPSRLLFACEPEQLPERVLRLADEKNAVRRPIPMGAPPAAAMCEFKVYQPPPGPHPLDRMRVTAFRNYLQCPLRWYLANAVRLQSIGDTGDELDPLAFGILAHEVLQQFGCDETMRDAANADEIHQWLSDRLARVASASYGKHPPPAVRIQLDRLERRFEGFARFQAQARAAGWRIVECEFQLKDCELDIPGQDPITVTGTIDRIDRHEESNALRIIDYKTGDRGDSPMKAHHDREKYDGEWMDLQLPLYRHLAAQCGYAGEVELGYINLPKDADAVDFCPAQWTQEQLDEAIETAREVVRNIRAGNFAMSPDFDSAFDDFANICQTNVLGRASRERELEAHT